MDLLRRRALVFEAYAAGAQEVEAATSCESPGFVRFKAQLRLIVIRFGSIMANRRNISRN